MADASSLDYTSSSYKINLKIDNIPGDTIVKKVFSTNVFIPMAPIISDKTLLYLCGFMKLVETFKHRTSFNPSEPSNNWYLYIYVDLMFFQEYNKEKYESSSSNNNINKVIKENYRKYEKELLKIHQMYKLFIAEIQKNEDNRYNFIRIFTFNFPDVIKKDKGYLGHPTTLGSIVRAEPLYGKDGKYNITGDKEGNYGTLEYVFLINCSHAITPNLMKMIMEWIASGAIITLNPHYNPSFSKDNNDIVNIMKYMLRGMEYCIQVRILAGILGYKINNGEIKNLMDYKNFIQKNRKPAFYSYGFDEVILTYIFIKFTILDYRHNNKNVFYLHKESNIDTFEKELYHKVEGKFIKSKEMRHDQKRDSYTGNFIYTPYYLEIRNKFRELKEKSEIPEILEIRKVVSVMNDLDNGIIDKHITNLKFISRSLETYLSDKLGISKMFEKYLNDSYKNKYYTIISLLGSYDEDKNYYIFQNKKSDYDYVADADDDWDEDDYIYISDPPLNKFFEVKLLTDYPLENIEILFKETLNYYRTKIILDPYGHTQVNSTGLSANAQAGGMKLTKKNKTKNKSKKQKRTKYILRHRNK